jgi:vacuolar-type H+-ATPase subunit I/STV1
MLLLFLENGIKMTKQNEEIKEEDIIEKSSFLKQIEKQEEKGIVKIDFGEEKIPIQSIKPIKKASHKPQKSQFQEQKTAKNEKKSEIEEIREIKQEINREDYPQEILNDAEEIEDIKQLEKEIKEKKKLLKLKKEEEIKKLEEIKLPQEEINTEAQEIRLIPANDRLLKICPLCNFKIKRSWVKRNGFDLIQHFKCKNKACNWNKKIIVRI